MDVPTPRIAKETNSLKTEHVAGIKCEADPHNFKHFFVKIDGTPAVEYLGPEKTCYEGGKFDAELLLPEDYPMSPPKVIFNTKIYHPNIGTSGLKQTTWVGSAWISSRRTGRQHSKSGRCSSLSRVCWPRPTLMTRSTTRLPSTGKPTRHRRSTRPRNILRSTRQNDRPNTPP